MDFAYKIETADVNDFWRSIGKTFGARLVIVVDNQTIDTGYYVTGATQEEANSKIQATIDEGYWAKHPYVKEKVYPIVASWMMFQAKK